MAWVTCRLLQVSVLAGVACVWPSLAGAQPSDPLPGRLSLGAGIRWTNRATIGSADATETTPAGGRFVLFRTNTSIARAAGVDSTIGIRLTRSVDAEVTASFTRPDLHTKVSADAEGAAGFTAIETMKEIAVEGSLVLHLTGKRLGARTIPYLSAGAGVLRDLHERDTLAEDGRLYHVGAGLHYLLKSSTAGGLNALGIRLDGRAVARSGGAAFDDNLHLAPMLSASLVARF
jgi:hypothetical protein